MYFSINFKKIINISCSYILSFIFILECRSIWLSIPVVSNKLYAFLFLLLTITAVLRLLTMPLDRIGIKKASLYSAIISVFFAMWFIATRYYGLIVGLRHLATVIIIIFSYFSSVKKEKFRLFNIYKQIILFIVALSLFFWLFGSILGIIHSTGSVESTWTGKENVITLIPTYYNIYFETQNIYVFGTSIIRNTAIFTEAPMASSHFSLAFLIELLVNKKIKIKNLLLLGIGVLTTTSTTGVILLLFNIVYYLIVDGRQGKIIKLLTWILFPIVFVISLKIGDTLLSSRLSTISGSIRTDDFIIGIKTWLQKPIFGSGFSNQKSIVANMGMWRSDNLGFSNSPTQILAQGGILMTTLYIIPFINGLVHYLKMRQIKYILFLLSVLYLFTFTVTTYQYIMIVLLCFFQDSEI